MSFPLVTLRSALTALMGAVICCSQTTSDPVSKVPSAALAPAPSGPYVIPLQSQSIASADLNGDGLPDLVISASMGITNSTITILLATTGGEFVPAAGSPIIVGYDHESLALADFNGDGNLDIASLGQIDLAIFLGDGKGGFTQSPTSPISIPAFGILAAGDWMAVGDLNGDGKADLVIGNVESTGDVLVLLGDGTGNFVPAPGSPTPTGWPTHWVTIGDFNMDGHPDLAVSYEGGNQVDVLLGDGTGRFSVDPKGPFPTGQDPIWMGSGDFNGDGHLDLAVVNWFVGTVTILLGDGNGGFTAEPEIPVPTSGLVLSWIVVGDIDGDGNLDLAMPGGSETSNGLFILLGDGKGGFHSAASGILNGLGDGPVALADFNGDGRLDAATANYNAGTLSVSLGAASASSTIMLSGAANTSIGTPVTITAGVNTSGFRAPIGTITVEDGTIVVGTSELTNAGATFRTTFSTAGAHSLVATYSGDAHTTGSGSSAFVVNVAKDSQTISFPAVANHVYGDAPFSVAASSSSGLPVTLAVVSGPATIAGNLVTLTGPGEVALQASQPGDATYLPAPSVQQQFQVAASPLRIGAVVNAASYSSGPLAPDSFGVVFGADLATLATVSSGNLPTTLGGAAVQMSDTSGNTGNALLYFASPTQVNFIVPANLSAGKGMLTLQKQTGPSVNAAIAIAVVSPGLFSADASGAGVAAGGAVRVSADGTQTQLPISSCTGTPLVCTVVPIDLGSATDAVYLSLYGTGIRGRSSLASVTATIGGVAVSVRYAGAQLEFPGLDQLNLQLDPSLRGKGLVPIALSTDGVAANAVIVAIQ